MFFWNPLCKVSSSADVIMVVSEAGCISLSRPPDWADWGVLAALKSGLAKEQLTKASFSEKRLLFLLMSKKLVIECADHRATERFDRSAGHFMALGVDPVTALRRLRSCYVCILGLGGVGSIVLQHLVAAGLKRYVLVDRDQVETSNLNRQFIYAPSDIGKNKVEVCRDYVASRNIGAEVSISTESIDSLAALSRLPLTQVDILIHCLDTPRESIDDIVYEYGARYRKAVITAGVGVSFGHWGPLMPPEEGLTFNEWKELHGYSLWMTKVARQRQTPTVWSFGATNTAIAAHLTQDVIEWLGGVANVRSLHSRLVQRFSDHSIMEYGRVSRRRTERGLG